MSEDLARANRQMVTERQALLAQLARTDMILKTRAVHSFSEVVDGMEQVLAQAAAGDNEARQLLSRFRAVLNSSTTQASALTVVRNGPS